MILSYGEWVSDHNKEIVPWEIVDTATAKYLEPYLSGYITGPMSISEKGERLEAKSVLFDSIDAIVEHVKKEVRSGSRVYLYKVIFRPSLPYITEMDPNSFEEIELDSPKMSSSGWQLRYAAI